jgi:hypothetical protein
MTKEFKKILTSDLCHTAILIRVAELEALLYQETHGCVIANRLRRFFIPLMLLLERGPDRA